MKIGKLYLIPTILGEGTEEKTLPSSVLNAIKDIDIFIVENIRTSRRFIKKMYKEKDIDNTIFYSYGKHDKLDLQEDFLPHIYEGKDVGIISEAGVPCVAFDVGANREILEDRITGLLAQDASSESLASKIKEIISDLILAEKLSKNGQEITPKKFNWDNTIIRLEEIFNQVVSSKIN